MPELMDPSELPVTKGPGVTPSQLIAWLLYPVIFIVGLAVGIIIGIKEGPNLTANKNTKNTNINYSNVSIVPGVNRNTNASNDNTNTVSNDNVNIVISNTNTILHNGDYVKLDATTQAQLDQQKAQDLANLVDQTASFTDVLRQQDLINLKYTLLGYYAVRAAYPSTNGTQIHLDRSATDSFYTDMKDFYGGTFYEKIDPESPTYYYGYSSDGKTFTLTAFLRSKNKAFTLMNP